VELFELEARRKGLELHLDISPDTPRMLVGDEGRIRQILMNLVANALKFTNEGEVALRVTAGAANGDGFREITLTVTDTGIGIPPEKRQILFQPFSQGDASFSRRFGGTGLGLAICREMVERMGGTITLVSEPDQGSTFTVTLPLRETAALPAAMPAPPAPANDRQDKPRLLVAEDSPIIQKLLAHMLRHNGFDFDTATNGEEALALWARGSYDLILMDVQMPAMNGFETTRAIRSLEEEHGGHVPIIALTAHAYPADREKCLGAGMDAYVAKPINFSQLFTTIEGLFQGQAQKGQP
jgi:CheY-like chemotaxis protein